MGSAVMADLLGMAPVLKGLLFLAFYAALKLCPRFRGTSYTQYEHI